MGTSGLADGRADVLRQARQQCGVVSLRQVYAAGLPRWVVRRQLKVGRWRRTGRQTVAVHNGPLDDAARRAVAVLEVGPRAALDGVSVLQHAGVSVSDDGWIHVIVPPGAAPPRLRGVRVHESRRFRESDVVLEGLRRVRPAVAAVHAALWARTEREATLLLTVPVQQRLATAAEVWEAVHQVVRSRRRRLLRQVAVEHVGGVRSVGEFDVAAALRRRGLPEPERQAVRLRPSGTHYLDADFPAYRVTLEVDGAQHDAPAQRLADLLRDLESGAEGRTVVRVPLVAWRLDEEAVLDGLETRFAARGWRRPAA